LPAPFAGVMFAVGRACVSATWLRFVTDNLRVPVIQSLWRFETLSALRGAMQFHLEPQELNLLANILLEQDPRQYNELLNKVLARDLRFDSGELEQTADLLMSKKRSLKDEIALQPNVALKADLQRKLTLLERVLERVTEVCVMF